MNEPNKALQEEELISLQAIFGDDWHDIPAKKTAWGTEGEHGWWEVQLHATDDDRVRVKLRGRMTKTYPDQPPPLSILDPVKVTPKQVQELTKLLHEQAKTKVGEQMIFDLCDFVQSWLAENHVPLPKPGEPEPTLMEEMALREEAKRAAEEAQHLAARKERLAAEAERNRVLNEKIQLDASRKEERVRKALLDQEHRRREERVSGLDDGEFEMRQLVLDEPISIDGHQGKWAKWTVFGGRREALWTSYAAEPVHDKDQDFVRASNPTVTVQVVDFSKPYYNGAHGRKRIDTLTNELLRLKGVHSKHVARLYAVQRTKSPKGWERLIVVVERVADVGRLRTWLPKDGFEEETAKEYMAQILAGLADLHRAHAMQKRELIISVFELTPELDCDLVLLSAGAGDEVVLKLSGTGYARRIVEYHRSNPFLKLQEDGYPDSWLSPDEIDTPYSYSPKRDIWYAGLVFLQMLFGRNSLWTYPDLQTLLAHAPGGVSPSVADLLSGLLNPVHKKRLTAEEALTRLRAPEDEITHRPSLTRSIPGSISVPGSTGSSFHPDMFGKSPQSARGFGGCGGFGAHFPPTPGGSVRYSRYRADFEEVEFLGKGGFGEVVKARNKLDGRPYAIKKVKLRPEDDVNRVLREVNSLSRVSHQYIVRYYSCWLEDVGGGDASADDTGSETLQSSIHSSNVSSESEDIFAVNFDDISRREQSRSASFPRIRFAADSEGEDDDDDDSDEDSDDGSDASDESNESEHTIADPSSRRRKHTSQAISVPSKPSKPSASWTDASTEDGSVQRILYIQMEFVEKQTLREAITAGLSEEECWRLLVQILQALSHMSSLGIVHRDLKPSNILLDANGNVKIADFGLSVCENDAMGLMCQTTDLAVEAGVGLTASASADDIDRTSNIGTSLYIAPEVLVSKSYNEKADMYSLGIILFEMCFAFNTGMERAHTLNALRAPSIVFPPGWPTAKMPKQREIITLLLSHDPQMRPQANQLLSGPLVPTINREEQFYDHVITEITNPRSEKYPTLIEALFETDDKSKFSTDNRQDDYTFDNDHDDTHELWQVVVKGRIKKLLRRHGAIEAVLPLLIPETTLLKPLNERAVVRLLDSSGKFVHLPTSNIVGMARSASRQSISRIKRYVAGNRYSELPAGGQPATHCEICFEIISTIRAHAAETELLQLMDRVIEECHGPRLSTHIEYELHVSHETILQSLLSTCPGPLRSKVLRAFKGPTAGVAFGASRPSLSSISGLPKTVATDLETISPVGDFETVRQTLEETYPQLKRKLAPTLEELSSIISLARACGVKMKILFRPTLSRHSEYFRGGFMFECVRKGKLSDVIAYGGRHDSLLDHFKDPGTMSSKVHGVAVSISADHVTRMVRNREIVVGRRLMNKTKVEERSFGMWAPARCDVYISFTTGVTIRERLVVAAQLWRAGIRADLQYDDDRTQQDVLDECLDQSVLFVVILRPHKDEAKVIRVLTGKNSEESVSEDKLVPWLKTAIENQRRIDRAYAEGATPVVKGQAKDVPEQQHSTRVSSADINLVLPPEPFISRGVKNKAVRKYRHTTKSLYYEKADEFAASVKSTMPVIGVDMSLELLSQLTLDTAWISDDEAWRALTHSVLPTSERSYAAEVRRAVVEHTKSPGGNVWLFSVRDARGFLLQLSK